MTKKKYQFHGRNRRDQRMLRQFFLLLFAFTLAACPTSGPDMGAANQVDSLMRKSKIVFSGTVLQIGATTMPNLPLSDRTMIVRVDELLHSPPALGNFVGREITVEAAKVGSMAVGQEAVFFTNSWLYGESIAVTEVGHIDAGGSTDAIREQIGTALSKMSDDELKARLQAAALVVVGSVSTTRPADKQNSRLMISEHRADWWEAHLKIDQVLRGEPRDGVTILFPNSTDEVWYLSPKFKEGHRGIWILQSDQTERGAPMLRLPGFTALNPLDFQPVDQQGRIEDLIGELK